MINMPWNSVDFLLLNICVLSQYIIHDFTQTGDYTYFNKDIYDLLKLTEYVYYINMMT